MSEASSAILPLIFQASNFSAPSPHEDGLSDEQARASLQVEGDYSEMRSSLIPLHIGHSGCLSPGVWIQGERITRGFVQTEKRLGKPRLVVYREYFSLALRTRSGCLDKTGASLRHAC
jgi:hypothetical protein